MEENNIIKSVAFKTKKQKRVSMKKIILASKSPRRKELLSQIDIEFECVEAVAEEKISSDIDKKLYELYKDTIPGQVMLLALQKAKEVAEKTDGEIIVAADTVVELNGNILGKPTDETDAKRMLRLLSGRKHQVHTGVCIYIKNSNCENIKSEDKNLVIFYETTDVFVKDITDEEIDRYVATKEPMDKAGAYGIQGRAAAFIYKIEGDYNNVVGLPLSHLYDELKKIQ